MTFVDTAALFGTMLILALTPGIGALTVTTRTLSGGLPHGFATIMGMILGDIIFILLVVYGLALFASSFAHIFALLNFMGGIYLLWLGISLWRTPLDTKTDGIANPPPSSLSSSVITGLLITLGNQKAIFFYVSFLPAFLDLTAVTPFETLSIMASATVAISIAMTVYALLASRASTRAPSRLLPRLASITLIIIALAVLYRLPFLITSL